jgi:natural product precursor
MEKKLKLTDLRHLEASKEEMKFIKGGDDPEQGPLFCRPACDCTISCVDELNNRQSAFENERHSQSGRSTMSSAVDVGIFIAGIIIGKLL